MKQLESAINMWVYWKNECKVCLDRNKCSYRKDTEAYKEQISSIKPINVYGSLSWKCDYFILDEKEVNDEQNCC